MNKSMARSPRHALKCPAAIDDALTTVLFKALCDPTRTRLLACMAKCGRACTVSEMAACCVVDLSVVSRHLSHLARAGVIESNKQGRTVFYRVRYSHIAQSMRTLAEAFDACCPGGTEAVCCSSQNTRVSAKPRRVGRRKNP